MSLYRYWLAVQARHLGCRVEVYPECDALYLRDVPNGLESNGAFQTLADRCERLNVRAIRDWNAHAPLSEKPMTKGQLIRTITGLAIVAALYSFAFTWWGEHDPRIGEAFMIWVATPVVNMVAIGMACLQIRFYRQGQGREGNS